MTLSIPRGSYFSPSSSLDQLWGIDLDLHKPAVLEELILDLGIVDHFGEVFGGLQPPLSDEFPQLGRQQALRLDLFEEVRDAFQCEETIFAASPKAIVNGRSRRRTPRDVSREPQGERPREPRGELRGVSLS